MCWDYKGFLRLTTLIIGMFWAPLCAQQNKTEPSNGPVNNNPNCYAFTNAVVHINGTTQITQATLIIEKGRVQACGTKIPLPSHAVIVDLKGAHVYPSFIDLYASYGVKSSFTSSGGGGPQYTSKNNGAVHWNESIHPEKRAVDDFVPNADEAGSWREAGFGAVLTHKQDGIMRGTASLVTLEEADAKRALLVSEAAAMLSMNKGSSTQAYPSSLMGNIALLRQTYFDLVWYEKQTALQEKNLSYEALIAQKKLPQIIETGEKYSILRAHKIAREFNLNYIMLATGAEYQRLKEIKATKSKLIVPLNFPDVYDVNDVYDAERIPLGELLHWEWAPFNPAKLHQAGMEFCLTANGLTDKKEFINRLRKAVKHGLPQSYAIDALTRIPAQWMRVFNEIGSIETGKWASFIIVSDDIFKDDARIIENWVQGKKYPVYREETPEIRGTYDLNVKNTIYTLTISGDNQPFTAEVKLDTIKVKAHVAREGLKINVSFIAADKSFNGSVRLSGNIHFDSGMWDGNGVLPNGENLKWTAIRKERYKTPAAKASEPDSLYAGKLLYPLKPYGSDTIMQPKVVVIKNTTVWTNEKDGILKNADVVIKDGKISYVGKPLASYDAGATIINGEGKHVTAGIIDEHSHIAIYGGVNEGGQAVSAEVSIGDVIFPDDINIYRQLAGGVTTSQLLHGSANPIGGRSAIIKLRWGKSPDEMVFKEAPGFIKFALGENVKQSNWGDGFRVRYPQTRMGVEQMFFDAFHRAKAYEAEWKLFNDNKTKSKKPLIEPRRDIELDALVEILNKKRFITCHSYVQSEINMLMHVADSMGFKVNTFTHILEGYKVADKMAAHGASGSSFSDWWAYKFEVYDAIPYNAAIMHKQGVNVGMNSDDAEMARRLNQEAAKAVKYGGVSEEEALKMVTLNPAKMLHVDNVTGSIAVGKHADVVIWSDNPLSVYAKAEKTFVDGVCYYDVDRDKEMRKQMAAERERIIRKMMEAKQKGAKTQAFRKRGRRLYECETMGYDEENE